MKEYTPSSEHSVDPEDLLEYIDSYFSGASGKIPSDLLPHVARISGIISDTDSRFRQAATYFLAGYDIGESAFRAGVNEDWFKEYVDEKLNSGDSTEITGSDNLIPSHVIRWVNRLRDEVERLDPLCREIGTEAYYDLYTRELVLSPEAKLAQETCEKCRAKIACLSLAIIEGEPFGIWGGTTPRERKVISEPLGNDPSVDEVRLAAEQYHRQLS